MRRLAWESLRTAALLCGNGAEKLRWMRASSPGAKKRHTSSWVSRTKTALYTPSSMARCAASTTQTSSTSTPTNSTSGSALALSMAKPPLPQPRSRRTSRARGSSISAQWPARSSGSSTMASAKRRLRSSRFLGLRARMGLPFVGFRDDVAEYHAHLVRLCYKCVHKTNPIVQRECPCQVSPRRSMPSTSRFL